MFHYVDIVAETSNLAAAVIFYYKTLVFVVGVWRHNGCLNLAKKVVDGGLVASTLLMPVVVTFTTIFQAEIHLI